MGKDYYVSFHEADTGWAEWLAWELEEAGLGVHFEGWGGRLHGDRLLGLQRALAQAHCVLLVLSPDYLAAELTQRELSAALSLPADRVLPVRVRSFSSDALPPQVDPLDLTGCPRDEARRRLQVALRGAPKRPDKAPDFPGEARPHSVPREPAFPGGIGPADQVARPADEAHAATDPGPPPVQDAEALRPELLLDGKWRIEKRLGQGGMGEVWLARHQRLGKPVAIKALLRSHAGDPRLARRFFQEARAVAQLGLPGLVGMEDYGQLPGGTAYLVMEFLPGESLGQRLRGAAGAGLGLPGLRLLAQLAEVLAAVHARSVVHRDLKPDNVMVVPDPGVPGGERVKVLDFGIAKVASDEGSTAGTQAGQPMGTPAYMAPEQFRDASSVGAAADVYSLGIMLYEVAAGRRPFEARLFPEWVHRHCLEPPPPLRAASAPAGLAALCAAMLAKDAAVRPGAAQVAERLQVLLAPRVAPPPPGGVGKAAAGAVAAAAVTGLCVWLVVRPSTGGTGTGVADLGQAAVARDLAPPQGPAAQPKRKIPLLTEPAAEKATAPPRRRIPVIADP